MRTKVTLILIFLNVALFFFIFYVRPQITVSKELIEARTRVLPESAADIREIEITVGKQLTRLVRHGELWYLAAPIEWPANPHAVSHILTELQFLRHETAFPVSGLSQNKLSLADYGLETPAITVSLTPTGTHEAQGHAPQKLMLRIGNATNVGNRLYVLSPDGSRIHVVSRSLADSLSLPLEQLRSNALFTIPEFEVRNFTIQPAATASARTRLRRDGSRWAMENPIQTRANTAAVKQTLVSLNSLQVGTFVTQALPPELSPASTAALRITLEGNNRSETLLLGNPVPKPEGNSSTVTEYYAQFEWKVEDERKSAVFSVTVPSALFDSLRSAQEKLRENQILDFDTRRISAILLRAPNQPELSLQRLDSTAASESVRWQIVRRIGDAAPTTLPADSAVVQDFLEELQRLRARRFVSDAPGAADLESWGFNRPERSVALTQEPDPSRPRSGDTAALTTSTLEIGVSADRGPVAFARLDPAKYIYEVDAEILRRCPVDPKAWRDRTVRELPAGARIVSLRLTDLGSGKPILETALPLAADSALPEERRQAVAALAAGLRSLRAKAYLADHYGDSVPAAGAQQPWKYRLDLGIALQSANGGHTDNESILLTERLAGGVLAAGSAEYDAAFELEQPIIDALWPLISPPAAPQPAPAG